MNMVRVWAAVQLAAAAIALVITLVVAWSGWSRWDGISHIRAARTRMVDAYDDSVRRNAAAAAAALPHEPAAVLLDIDLTKEADYPRIEALERKCPPAERSLVQTAEALSLTMRGMPASDVGGADGALLKVIADLAKGAKPSAIVLGKEAPPHSSLLIAAYEAQLRAAFAANDRALVRDAAGMLALLMPGQAEGPRLNLICATLDPDFDVAKLPVVGQRVLDRNAFNEVLLRLSALAPERAAALDAMALGVQPGLSAADSLAAQVNAAIGKSGAVDMIALARRCFAAGRPELAKPLIPKLPAEAQPAFRTLIMNQEGDVAELAKIGAATPALAPRLTTPRCRPGLIAFHLSNDLGMVPKSKITVKLDGNEVAPAKITRTGTLYAIETASSGPVLLEVAAGGASIFTGKVIL